MPEHRDNAYELETKDEQSEALVRRLLIQIKTGGRKNAGTDANVTFRMGNLKLSLDSLGDVAKDRFECGNTNTFIYQINQEVDGYFTLQDARDCIMELCHDNTGNKPGWYVESVLLQLCFDPNSVNFINYKKWEKVGWLALDEKPNSTSVVLQ
ncbi:MAG TPA: PLAT/LH2 domain-containing protein [Dongiaceae bacterium]|nr:PLAT/LH2 domain-containing protein [Dongiaceae bacterium]